MVKVGDVAKGFLIFFCGIFVWAALMQAISGHTALALFMFAGSLVPLAIVASSYVQDLKQKNTLDQP
jgi:hypothetical protein